MGHAGAPYLEVVLQSVAAGGFVALATGEIVAQFAGGVGAVHHELRADGVVQVPRGVSHDAGAWGGGDVRRVKDKT